MEIMMNEATCRPNGAKAAEAGALPVWLPTEAQSYLRHVEEGLSIRALARAEGCHASTILRRVRRTESRREDPLIDAALSRIGRALSPSVSAQAAAESRQTAKTCQAPTKKDLPNMTAPIRQTLRPADSDHLLDEGRRVLRRLAEPGAVLALAKGMDKAVVMRGSVRTAILEQHTAEAFALKGWIELAPQTGEPGAQPSRIARYRLTGAGRQFLRDALQDVAPHGAGGVLRAGDFSGAEPVAPPSGGAQGMAEAAAVYAGPEGGAGRRTWGERVLPDPETGRRKRMRVNLAESPLTMLARRRDKDGKPFLGDDLVSVGERLREDFELAQLGPRVAQNWERFLTGGDRGGFSAAGGQGGSERARDRVAAALRDLGPGLGDMVLRVCCFLEGIEAAEQNLGWSARSGKIVLRIALIRLKRHYEESYGGASPLIG